MAASRGGRTKGEDVSPLKSNAELIDAIELVLVSGVGARDLLVEISRQLHMRDVVAAEAGRKSGAALGRKKGGR